MKARYSGTSRSSSPAFHGSACVRRCKASAKPATDERGLLISWASPAASRPREASLSWRGRRARGRGGVFAGGGPPRREPTEGGELFLAEQQVLGATQLFVRAPHLLVQAGVLGGDGGLGRPPGRPGLLP